MWHSPFPRCDVEAVGLSERPLKSRAVEAAAARQLYFPSSLLVTSLCIEQRSVATAAAAAAVFAAVAFVNETLASTVAATIVAHYTTAA